VGIGIGGIAFPTDGDCRRHYEGRRVQEAPTFALGNRSLGVARYRLDPRSWDLLFQGGETDRPALAGGAGIGQGIVEHAASSRGRHSPAVGAAVLVEPGGNLGMPLVETAGWYANSDTDGEAPLGEYRRFDVSTLGAAGQKASAGRPPDGRVSSEGSEAGSVPVLT
jgi:hypothetical protein